MTSVPNLQHGSQRGRQHGGRPPARQPDLAECVLTAELLRPSRGRRALDVAVAGTALLLAAPLLLLAALLVLLLDGRPVTFRQERLGEGGRLFRLLKLRTMRGADGSGPAVTAATDTRITRLGRLLRRTSVDELPQLWHVLRGDMTLVGPRPETVPLARQYPPSCRTVLAARPGLTGPAQLAYRERSAVPPAGWDIERWYVDVLVPLRTEADMEYLARPTLRGTLRYLVRTARFVTGLGDYERVVTVRESPSRTTSGSQRALTHSPVARSNSKL